MDQRRAIREDEWRVFDKYARRVYYIARQFSSTSKGLKDIDFSIFRMLQDRKGQPLFPCLGILSIPVPDIVNTISSCRNTANVQTYLANLAPFILATLTQVNLSGHRHGNCALNHAIVDLLSKSSPHLRHLRLDHALDAQILKVVPKFQHIKIFDLGFDPTQPYQRRLFVITHNQDVYAALFKMASSLTTLSTLLINGENAEKMTFPPFPPILNLSRLAIKVRRCSIITHIFPLIPNLTTLSISAADLHLEDMKELGAALFSCPLLRNLEVSACWAPKVATSTAVPDPFAMLDFVRPLKGLHLEVLVLGTFAPAAVEVSCGAVREIGSAFPNLRKLHLFPDCYSTKLPFSPIDASMAIARTCPHLVDFRISHSVRNVRQPIHRASFPTATTFCSC